MKKNLLILCAFLLTSIGASAADYTSSMQTTNTTGWTAPQNGSGPSAMSFGMEEYIGDGGAAGKVLYQTITSLPAGTYKVQFYAFARVARTLTGYATEGVAEAYASGASTATQRIDIPSSYVPDHDGWTDGDIMTLVCTVGDDGTLEYGLQNAAAGGQWYGIKEISLTLIDDTDTWTGTAYAHGCTATFDDWSISGNNGGSFQRNTWSTEGETSGMVTPFVEYWVGSSNNLSDATISHTQLANLPEGYYTVSIDARAFNEGDETPVTTGTVLYYAKGDGDSQNVSVDLATGTDNLFNGHFEYYGTYSVIANVSTAGTLDVGFTISGTNSDWVSWKNLDVVYMGTSLEYSIGTPTCSASCVKPGSTVSITFLDCITPTSGEKPTLDSSKYITVGDATVTNASLSYSGTTATVTFTMPETIGYGTTVTVTVPAGLLSWSGQSVSSTAAEFSIKTPIMADQDGVYILSVYDNEFLSRGYNYGTAADVDRYGVPVNIVFGDDGKATVEYMDSKLYLYGPNWAWSDAAAANASHYTLVAVEGEEGVYQFLGGTGEDDYPMYVYDVNKANSATDAEDTYRVANNGIKSPADGYNYTDDEQTYWKILTREERDKMKDAWVLGEYQEIAASFGATISSKEDFEAFLDAIGTGSDVTTSVTDASLKSVVLLSDEQSSAQTGWDIKYPSQNSAYPTHEGFTSDAYCSEMFQSDGDLYQNVDGLEPGLYKVTLKGFIRHGWYDTCVTYEDYDLSYAYLRANDYEINLVPWVKDATLGSNDDYSDSTPNNMATAGTAFDSTDPSKYDNTLYTIVGEDGKLSIEIACPGWLSSEWTCIRDLTLTYYGNPDVITWEMTEAGWGTLILPFDASVPEELTAYSIESVTEDDEEDGIVATLSLTASDAIAANTPYIMGVAENEEDYVKTYTFTGTPTNEQDSYTSDMLTGTFVDMDYNDLIALESGGSTVYLLQNHEGDVAFYPVVTTGASSEATLTPYHCYLTYGATTSPTKLVLGFQGTDGEATAIVAVESEEVEGNGAIYDLSGRRVAKAVKGVYIQNGKKVLVK